MPYARHHFHQILKAVTTPDYPSLTPDSDWRRDFVEDMGQPRPRLRGARALMRVLGWMVVCETPDQTASDVQKELGLSAGSVSTSLRSLGEMGLVERVSRPGDRRIFYRLNTEAGSSCSSSDSALSTRSAVWPTRQSAAAAGQANDRLHDMRDTWAFLEAGATDLLAEAGPAVSARQQLRANGRLPND